MADLNWPRSDRSDDRAQIMLVAGFVLAVTFIALAVMLNSVIYTENLATRGEDAHGSEAIAYRADAVAGTEQLIEYVNENQTEESFDNHVANLTTAIDSMDNGSAPILATGGDRTKVSLMSVTQGTWIGQFNALRDFTSDSGAIDWVLDNDIQGTRSFEINVTDSDELDTTSPFTIRLASVSGADVWTVQIYNQSGTAATTLDVVGGPTCDIGGLNPEINVNAGTVGGESCDGYEFADGISKPYLIEFQNAHNIQGNFSLVINSTNPNSIYYSSDKDTPFADDEAIYAATIHVLHESADHIYATDARAIPGENDA